MSSSSQNRIVWLDYAKVIGMFLVVLGHCYPFKSPPCYTRNIIYLFHMPLFFWISGLLFKDVAFPRLIKKGALSLIVPAFSWIGVWSLIYIFRSPSGWSAVLAGNLRALFNGQSLSCGPTWFLFALFWCQLLLWFLLRIHYPLFRFSLIILGVLIAKLLPCFFLGNALMALPFFSIAYFCKSVLLDDRRMSSVGMVCVLGLGIVFMMAAFCFGPVSISSVAFGNFWRFPVVRPINALIMYLISICGILFYIMLIRAFKFKRNSIIEEISVGLIIFLCFHYIFILTPFGDYFMKSLPDDTVLGFIIRILFSIFMMLLSWVVCKAVMRCRTLSFLSGYRTHR